MKAKRLIAPALIAACILSSFVIAGFAQDKKDVKQEKVFIPKEVKTVLQQGYAARQGRQDIPVSITKFLYLPAQENLYGIFYFKIKNSDLGFAPAAQTGAQPEATPLLQANFNVFLQFTKEQEGQAPQLVREVYVPVSLQEDPASYDPNKENYYSIGYPMPADSYVMSVAVTSLDLKRIGTVYYSFVLPDPRSFTEALGATPLFFTKKIDQIDAPETKTILHKDFFAYSILQVYPNLENIFAVGESMEILTFIFGAQANADDPQKLALETNFEVTKFNEEKKAEETAIRWATQNYDAPLIIQTLPMKQTAVIKDDKGERTETNDLAAGKYTLVMKMTDKNSGRAVSQSIAFEIK